MQERWKQGDSAIRIVADCGYLAHQRTDLPVKVCVRLRSDRVLYHDAPPGGGVGAKSCRFRRHRERFEG